MTYLFAVLAFALVLGVWGVYIRLGTIFESISATYDRDANAFTKTLKFQLLMIWARVVDPTGEKVGLGAAFLRDERLALHIIENTEWHHRTVERRDLLRERSLHLNDEEKKRLEQLERAVRMAEGTASPEDKAVWMADTSGHAGGTVPKE